MLEIIDLVNYFKKCPFLENFEETNEPVLIVDFMGLNITQYSINILTGATTVESYIDGSKLKKINFILASLENYSEDNANNTDNLDFFDKLSDWVEENQKFDNPHWDNLQAISNGYIFNENDNMTQAQYQMHFSLEYFDIKK